MAQVQAQPSSMDFQNLRILSEWYSLQITYYIYIDIYIIYIYIYIILYIHIYWLASAQEYKSFLLFSIFMVSFNIIFMLGTGTITYNVLTVPDTIPLLPIMIIPIPCVTRLIIIPTPCFNMGFPKIGVPTSIETYGDLGIPHDSRNPYHIDSWIPWQTFLMLPS